MSNTQSETRTRIITWEDPMPTAQRGRTMSGVEYLRNIQSGEVPPPPIAVLLG